MDIEDYNDLSDEEYIKLCRSICQSRNIILSEDDFNIVLDACNNPAEPNDNLKALLKDFRDECTQNDEELD